MTMLRMVIMLRTISKPTIRSPRKDKPFITDTISENIEVSLKPQGEFVKRSSFPPERQI